MSCCCGYAYTEWTHSEIGSALGTPAGAHLRGSRCRRRTNLKEFVTLHVMVAQGALGDSLTMSRGTSGKLPVPSPAPFLLARAIGSHSLNIMSPTATGLMSETC